MKYGWKPKTSIRLDAQTVGEHLDNLHERLGQRLTPADILKDAKRKRSPIHGAFEWDDAQAAVVHRLTQASYMLRSITVIVEECPDLGPVRAFVHVEREDSFYTNIRHAMSEPDLRQYTIGQAMRELAEFQKKYAGIKELAGVFAEIKKVAA